MDPPRAPIDLSALAGADASPHAAALLPVLAALTAAPPPAPDAAERAAAAVDAQYVAAAAAGVAEDWLWEWWCLAVGVARELPAADARMPLLVAVVAALAARRDDAVVMWGQRTRVWAELPMLSPCLRDAWNLRPVFDGSDADRAAVRAWVSLNAFAARVLGAGLQPCFNLAVWELRSGLEEPPRDAPGARETSLATACEWIAHAGPALYRHGHAGLGLDAVEERALRPGSLFAAGRPGLSDERWRFWTERLGLLGGSAGSAELRRRAQAAVESMKQLDEAP